MNGSTEIGGRELDLNPSNDPNLHGSVPDSPETDRTFVLGDAITEADWEILAARLTMPERTRNKFTTALNEIKRVDVPSEIYNAYEQVVYEQFLDSVFHTYSESVRASVLAELAGEEGMDANDYLEMFGDRVNNEIISRFEGDNVSATDNSTVMGPTLFRDTVTFAGDSINHVASGNLLGGMRRMNANDLVRLQQVLLPGVPRLVSPEVQEAETNSADTYRGVMEIIFKPSQGSQEVESEAEAGSETQDFAEAMNDEDLGQILDYLVSQSGSSPLQALEASLVSAEDRGLHDITFDSEVARTGSVMHAMDEAQQAQLVSYAISAEHYSPANDDVIVNLALYSMSGFTPRAAKRILSQSGSEHADRLIQRIDTEAEQAKANLEGISEAILTNLDQQSLVNHASDFSTALAGFGMVYFGIASLTNALLFATTGSPGALGYSLLFAGGVTVAADSFANRQPFSTLGNMVENLMIRGPERELYNQNVLRDVLKQEVFWNMPDDVVRGVGNEDVIIALKETMDYRDSEGFSREVFITNMNQRMQDTVNPERRASFEEVIQVLTPYFNSMPQDQADNQLYLLAHSFRQLEIHDFNDLDTRFLTPEGISLTSVPAEQDTPASTDTPTDEPSQDTQASTDTPAEEATSNPDNN